MKKDFEMGGNKRGMEVKKKHNEKRNKGEKAKQHQNERSKYLLYTATKRSATKERRVSELVSRMLP